MSQVLRFQIPDSFYFKQQITDDNYCGYYIYWFQINNHILKTIMYQLFLCGTMYIPYSRLSSTRFMNVLIMKLILLYSIVFYQPFHWMQNFRLHVKSIYLASWVSLIEFSELFNDVFISDVSQVVEIPGFAQSTPFAPGVITC